MSKQEKIVCAAIQVLVTRDGYSGSRIVKGVDYMSILEDKIIFEITDPYCGTVLNYGFVTNKNRFVDPKEAMQIAIKSGQYPDYELMKRKGLEEIGYAKENERRDKLAGRVGFEYYVAHIPEIVERIKELDRLLERKYLLPEDLY